MALLAGSATCAAGRYPSHPIRAIVGTIRSYAMSIWAFANRLGVESPLNPQGVAMSIRFPGESAEYRTARDRLLEQEKELRRALEAVAVARRALPPGGPVPEDYIFQGAGPGDVPTSVRLSDLFAPGKNSLAIYSFMYGPDRELPCPSCTAFLDALDGAAEHVSQRINLAVVAKSPLPRILAHARKRGWRRLRLVSSAGNSYNRDYFGETAQSTAFFKIPPGEVWEMPMMNVFRRDGGTIRHFWSSELLYEPAEPGQDPRHNGTLDEFWNMFDLTPEGRGTDWYPKLSYS
jgi:predicted dithiol-disulfide oxidoreductase (DUF899 family)